VAQSSRTEEFSPVNRVKQPVVRFDDPGTFSEDAEESGMRVLLPDLLTPSQFYAGPPSTPYHRLLLAVLEDAIRCFQRNLHARGGRGRVAFLEAKEWLFNTKDYGFMSCPVVCESLGIEGVVLRRLLREWQSRIAVAFKVPRSQWRTSIPSRKLVV
jgi:hypothetical protein